MVLSNTNLALDMECKAKLPSRSSLLHSSKCTYKRTLHVKGHTSARTGHRMMTTSGNLYFKLASQDKET